MRETSPSSALSMPGAIVQPSSRPSAETASNVVAVPRSTTMAGKLWRFIAASELTIRSGPTSGGLAVGHHDRRCLPPIPAMTGGRSKYVSESRRKVAVSGGTVDEIETPLMSRRLMPR